MKPNESILVVDDDLDFLGIIKRILGNKGYAVETVPTADEAITQIAECFYNAAILDISLPDADGTELLTRLIEMHPDIIAIILTGHSSVQNAVQSLNRGAFAYLEKPLDPEALLSVISRGLERQHLIMENRQLIDELEQRNRITDSLLSASQAVSQSLDQQQIIDSALENVAQSTGIEAGFVYLYDNDKLVLTGHYGFSPETAGKMVKEIERGSGIIGQIFEQAEPVIIDKTTDPPEPWLEFLNNGRYESCASVLLSILGESIGIMGVATGSKHRFTTKNMELIAGIGREIAIAVRNAQLYEEASSAKALRELDTMRTDFLANVSHELRTPLSVIKGSANSLLQPDVVFDEQTRREFLQSIDKDADTLTRLVEDLLMMSRLEAEALEVKKKPHRLTDVISLVKDRLDNLTAKHHLLINIPDKLPTVAIDDGRIGEVLTNLVENSVKYSEENTNIVIEANPNGKEIIVSVTDEGIGIPAELHQQIFDRFFQGDGHKTGRRKGTGLGLAICRGIVETHGGRIWVKSEPSRGAKFSFSLQVD